MSSLNYMELCRLCLVKERVSIPIFEGEGDVRQIFLKIASCLPVKVARDDKLPKKICDDCMYKLDSAYQFWNTTANAEKQLLQWLGEIASDDKKSVPSNTIETEQLVLKEEAVEQDQGSELAKSLSRVEAVLADDDRGGSEDEEESDSEDEGSNSEDSGDDDGGEAPSKEEAESDEEPYERLEPTTFVNVSLAGCDEAGPSGIQQQQQQQQQQSQQQSQSSQLVQQSSQSQFLTPGAPSTSTAAPASASGFSEDTNIEDSGVRGTAHMDITGFSLSEKAGNTAIVADASGVGHNQAYTFVPVAYVSSQPFKGFSDGNKPINFCIVVPTQSDISASSNVKQTQIRTMPEASTCITKTATAPYSNLNPNITLKSNESVEVFRCELCGKEFSSKSRLDKHGISHKSDRPFTCNFCDKAYKRKHELTAHKKLHIGTKDKKCDICGFATTSKQSLQLHKKRHLGEYDFKCEVCSKGFVSNSDLEKHKVSHTGRPFKCDVCGIAFFHKSHLKMHIIYRHKAAEQDMPDLECEVCGSKFRLRRSLLAHVKSHTGYLCDLCGKSLSTRTSLWAHCRTHTGEKPEICNVCGKTFSKSSNLRLHMRTHTGERPHSCDLCGKTFTQRTSLTVHKRYHTGDRPYKCNICHKNFVTKTLMKTHQKRHDVSQ